MAETLHQRLIARQPLEELQRKADKAARWKQRIWTLEELDWARRHAHARGVQLGWWEEGDLRHAATN